MTNLVETVTVRIALHRDKADSFPYDSLWGTLRKIWPHVCPWRQAAGYINMHNIEIEWTSSGLTEEHDANDN
jgi:hypothetical protein